jgi:hypothetical protein
MDSMFILILTMLSKRIYWCIFVCFALAACKKQSNTDTIPTPPESFSFNTLKVNGVYNGFTYTNINTIPVIKLSFSTAINHASIANSISFKSVSGTTIPYNTSFEDNDNTVVISPLQPLQNLAKYSVGVTTDLKSTKNGNLQSALNVQLLTTIDSTNKFQVVTDDQLLDIIQKQTFKYFWDFGHPVSGLARERNTSGEIVTTGGSGFGIMAIVVAVNRQFITRADGLARMQKIVGFLKNTAQKFHGAFPHWLNGTTGMVVPFSSQDNGADLVETSFLMEGLLTARQYFNDPAIDETNLRNDINALWNNVEWDWFRQNNQNVLYWHWSPDQGWVINMPIHGWDEALMPYVLGASSTTHSIPKVVYDNGWAGNGAMKNGNSYNSTLLPLGPAYGGPLFFEHYSFMAINPNGLSDVYANYETQTKAHTIINYNYCINNPKGYYGYSNKCWGLTASDIASGYTASSPTNDVGVIAPTAAISSLPYTPIESLKALKFFYYQLGDKIWGQYGFYDAFSLNDPWFANSYLAIDQGPIIVMTENYRSGLIWNLFMSCPEIKTGMKSLGFTSPNL